MPPGFGATAAEWNDFRSKKLLRILPADEGFSAWTQGKRVFFEGIKAAVRDYFDTQEDKSGVAMLQAVESSFPLILEEI